MAKDPRQEIREAISRGLRGEELERLFERNLENINALPDDEQTQFLQEIHDDPEVAEAYQDVVFDPDRNPNFQAGMAPLLGGIGKGAQVLAKGNLATGARTEFVEAAAKNPLLKRAVQFLWRNKGKAALGGAAVGLGFFEGLFEDEEGQQTQAGQQPTTPTLGQTPRGPGDRPGEVRTVGEANLPPGQQGGQQPGATPPDQGFNVMVIDHDGSITGTPGAVAVVSSAEMGLAPDPGLTQFLAEQSLAQTGTPLSETEMLSQYLQAGAQAQAAAGSQREVRQVLFPESLGQVTVDVPFQVQPTTSPEQERAAERRGVPGSVQPGVGTPIGSVTGTVDLPGGPTRVDPGPTNVPAGGKLAPRVFNRFRGRTLMEWANLAAQQNNVPLNILYGVIDHESNFLPSAIGDNGNSFGLAQIYMPVWGEQVSKSQALNPVFALNWTAQKLRQRFNTYGTWESAVAAHNSPAAADYLARTGKFQNDKSASYVSDVVRRANESGLANYLFDDPGATTPVADTSGPEFAPFQTPDPAASRDYAREVYESLLGREPTEDEYQKEVERIKKLARQAYDANIRQAMGSGSEEVDIEAQFEEGIRETGEFAFHEEVTEQRDFTNYAASIARLLQQGV